MKTQNLLLIGLALLFLKNAKVSSLNGMKYYKTISKKEWDSTHKDYKSIIDGEYYIMVLDREKGMSVLAPVKVI